MRMAQNAFPIRISNALMGMDAPIQVIDVMGTMIVPMGQTKVLKIAKVSEPTVSTVNLLLKSFEKKSLRI